MARKRVRARKPMAMAESVNAVESVEVALSEETVERVRMPNGKTVIMRNNRFAKVVREADGMSDHDISFAISGDTDFFSVVSKKALEGDESTLMVVVEKA